MKRSFAVFAALFSCMMLGQEVEPILHPIPQNSQKVDPNAQKFDYTNFTPLKFRELAESVAAARQENVEIRDQLRQVAQTLATDRAKALERASHLQKEIGDLQFQVSQAEIVAAQLLALLRQSREVSPDMLALAAKLSVILPGAKGQEQPVPRENKDTTVIRDGSAQSAPRIMHLFSTLNPKRVNHIDIYRPTDIKLVFADDRGRAQLAEAVRKGELYSIGDVEITSDTQPFIVPDEALSVESKITEKHALYTWSIVILPTKGHAARTLWQTHVSVNLPGTSVPSVEFPVLVRPGGTLYRWYRYFETFFRGGTYAALIAILSFAMSAWLNFDKLRELVTKRKKKDGDMLESLDLAPATTVEAEDNRAESG